AQVAWTSLRDLNLCVHLTENKLARIGSLLVWPRPCQRPLRLTGLQHWQPRTGNGFHHLHRKGTQHLSLMPHPMPGGGNDLVEVTIVGLPAELFQGEQGIRHQLRGIPGSAGSLDYPYLSPSRRFGKFDHFAHRIAFARSEIVAWAVTLVF